MKAKILFVDDDRNILDSLRLALRTMRGEWDMRFAASGPEALALLDEGPTDVVVTDMRMPGMDGAQLLAEVQARQPAAVRMILSGYADRESVMRTVKLAHQFLSKPAPPGEIKDSIARSLRLRGVIASPELRGIIARIDTLPALPPLYTQLTAALADESCPLAAIGEIIAKDVGMATGILRLVNSAFFGLPVHVSSVPHAVSLLGTETIRVLVLSIHLFRTQAPDCLPGFDLRALWEHSARVACFAKSIAEVERLGQSDRDDCFIAGTLHDAGKLVLACALPGDYARALALARQKDLRLHEAEREVLGASHAEVGAYLFSLWGFSDSVVEAVCWHHDPERVLCSDFSPLTAVAVANAFDHDQCHAQDAQACSEDIPCIGREEYMERLTRWRELCLRGREPEI
jgi:HD-like signal output (HDOD) protein/ActR/RegA family two-component response regulator